MAGMGVTEFQGKLVSLAERYFTRRRAVRRVRKARQKAKSWVVDWIEAFLWAAGMVLLINQYLVQAYIIPSGSMIDTLLLQDRIFVNKLIYGPELLPGLGKLPSPIKPKRNEIIIFENPSYISRGTAFDIAQRVIFMLTLAQVDIDRDENGYPKPHFLIKRAAGYSGDTLINKRGDLLIRAAGETAAIPEAEFNRAQGYTHHISRLMDSADYPALEASGRASAYMDLGLSPPEPLLQLARSAASAIEYPDYITHEAERLSILHAADPDNPRYGAQFAQFRQGWYIAEGRVMPLGDNRDNSRDGRYFGSVKLRKILGKGAMIHWPLRRIGVIK
jgi:signal peptidase I